MAETAQNCLSTASRHVRETLQEEEQTAQSLGRLSKSLGHVMPSGEDEKGGADNEAKKR